MTALTQNTVWKALLRLQEVSLLLAGVAATIILLAIILRTPEIRVLDQGDYARTASRILDITPPPPAYHLISEDWKILPMSLRPNLSSGSTSILIFFSALLQSTLGDRYSNSVTLAVLIALCTIGFFLLQQSTMSVRPPSLWTAITLCALFVASPQIVGYLSSFYGEALFIALLPCTLAFLPMCARRKWQVALAFIVVTTCATSKPQLFYLPSLFLAWHFLYFHNSADACARKKAGFVLMMALSQVVTMIPLFASKYSDANYHNAIYTGLLLVIGPAESGIAEKLDPKCIGVDYWGNRIESAGDDSAVAESICTPSTPPTLGLVVKLMLSNPSAVFRLTWQALPTHSTMFHFHLDKDRQYIVIPEGTSRAWTLIDRVRDKMLGGFGIFLVPALVLALSFMFPKRQAVMLSFCAVFSISQIFTAVGGEGVRDLSRHLLPAQTAAYLGLLLVLLFSTERMLLAWLASRIKCNMS